MEERPRIVDHAGRRGWIPKQAVEPLGTIEDDPNVTDKRFPGNPTRSYRTREPLRVVEEIHDWTPPPDELVDGIRQRVGELTELGIEAMDD